MTARIKSYQTLPLLRLLYFLQDEVEAGLLDHDENANRPEVQSQRPATPEKAITFLSGWKIPGVAEFALSLFFCKLVSYTFLYWLPTFIKEKGKGVLLIAVTTKSLGLYFATFVITCGQVQMSIFFYPLFSFSSTDVLTLEKVFTEFFSGFVNLEFGCFNVAFTDLGGFFGLKRK